MRFNCNKILAVVWCTFAQNFIYASAKVTAPPQSYITGWLNVEVSIEGDNQNFPNY